MKKILIIEDAPDIIKVLKKRLIDHHYKVISAVDGEEGLAKFIQEQPDLILLDLNLPKINGHEVCRQIRIDLKKTTPIIMLTAASGGLDKIVGRLDGANKYMTKPFNIDELLAVIKDLLIK